VYSVLQALRGTELVEDARLFGADPTTGQRGQAVQRLQIEPHALVEPDVAGLGFSERVPHHLSVRSRVPAVPPSPVRIMIPGAAAEPAAVRPSTGATGAPGVRGRAVPMSSVCEPQSRLDLLAAEGPGGPRDGTSVGRWSGAR